MPKWIQDSEGRVVKLETPHNKELELSLNIMETTPEDSVAGEPVFWKMPIQQKEMV